MLEIKIAGVIKNSIVDGPGMRYVIFTQGCPHKCEQCHNPETHSFTGGKSVLIKDLAEEIISSKTRRLTFSGGEPFCQAKELVYLSNLVLSRVDVSIITYTGYSCEDLLKMAETDKDIENLLAISQFLIDGKYVHSKRNSGIKFRGSLNQRVFDFTDYNFLHKFSDITLDWDNNKIQTN